MSASPQYVDQQWDVNPRPSARELLDKDVKNQDSQNNKLAKLNDRKLEEKTWFAIISFDFTFQNDVLCSVNGPSPHMNNNHSLTDPIIWAPYLKLFIPDTDT